jgi:transcriptional regulator with XRE-family HTH domain
MNKVFNKIKLVRKFLGLSQEQFAEKAGVNRTDVSKLERGGKKFIDTEIVQYLNVCGVDIASLFDDNREITLKDGSSITGKEEVKKAETAVNRLQKLKKIQKDIENNDFPKHSINTVEDRSNSYVPAPPIDHKDMVIKLQEEVIHLMAINKKLELRIKDLERTGVSDTNAKSA